MRQFRSMASRSHHSSSRFARDRAGAFRTALLTAIVTLLPLGCASNGGTSNDSAGAPLGPLGPKASATNIVDLGQGGSWPTNRPAEIFVADFLVSQAPAASTADSREGPLRRLASQLTGSDHASSDEARSLVDTLTKTIVSDLEQRGIPARRVGPGDPLPTDGWLVHGAFVETDDSGRIRRAIIGFGASSATMELIVAVDDLASSGPRPILSFETESDSGRRPGAIVTLNPYATAAKFVFSRLDPTREASRCGAVIAQEVAARARPAASPSERP